MVANLDYSVYGKFKNQLILKYFKSITRDMKINVKFLHLQKRLKINYNVPFINERLGINYSSDLTVKVVKLYLAQFNINAYKIRFVKIMTLSSSCLTKFLCIAVNDHIMTTKISCSSSESNIIPSINEYMLIITRANVLLMNKFYFHN